MSKGLTLEFVEEPIILDFEATVPAVWGGIGGTLASQTDLMAALSSKQAAQEGKGLSTNDFTNAFMQKLEGLSNYELPEATEDELGGIKVGEGLNILNGVLSAEAQAQQQADYTETNATLPSFILHKPDLSIFATKTELSQKQDALGFTPENSANKGEALGYASLDLNKKIELSQIPDSILGQLHYMGSFDVSGGVYPSGAKKGDYYISSTNGIISGIDYKTGDWLVYNGVSWDKIDNTDAVASVNGQIGTVILSKNDVGLSAVLNFDTTTTANISDSLNKRFVTDAFLTILGNTSNTNTGDETGAGIKSKLEALTDTNRLDASAIKNLPAPDLSGVVPYTGATGDLDLGVNNITLGNINLPTTSFLNTGGKIYKNGGAFISDFAYGNNGTVTPVGANIFIGTLVGNYTMGSTATQTYHSSYNVGLGYAPIGGITTGYANLGIGNYALAAITTGANCVGIGNHAGHYLSDGVTPFITNTASAYIGSYTKSGAEGSSNEIVIGNNAVGNGTNTVTIGHTSITQSFLRGVLNLPERSSHPTDTLSAEIQIYGKGQNSDGKTILALRTEAPTITSQVFTITNRMKISINGVEYWIPLGPV